ncbi:leucyl-tRNA synthetase [Thecamonas trahens ATCC 50062]|uniref:Leucyl-tRNA synthetase n=1 Tax=Thecamonas trahens ATCC 50062 TaxID=461836 RepID=A0A0L0DEK8_THETB|nr:leucyl-tRNA synthetase [Thecamonas trahens ATCC 50062]KNC50650.1 leucyl-tRNA synthetase [Thecamonas trahens ATCC 50062]|eukprot:XP_013762533.1 leucyl-tRNA synthetase [Thecamonas trahens ATCC 50062]
MPRSPLVRVGIPFVGFMVAGLYGATYMMDKKFERSTASKTNVTLEERTKRHVKKRKVSIEEEYQRLRDHAAESGSNYENKPVPRTNAPRSL